MNLIKINTGIIEMEFEEMYRLISSGTWQDYPYITPEGEIRLAMRSVFLIKEDRKILIDPGPGYFIEDMFPEYRFRNLKDVRKEIAALGIDPGEITDIFLSHLHFDHCGGIFSKEGNELVPAFPGARIHYSRLQSEAANNPDEFESSSYLPGWQNLIASQNIILYEKDQKPDFFSDVFFSDGHTEGMMVPFFKPDINEYAFLSDLIPTALNEEPEVISIYDRDPELLVREKMLFLEKIKGTNCGSIYFHDTLDAS